MSHAAGMHCQKRIIQISEIQHEILQEIFCGVSCFTRNMLCYIWVKRLPLRQCVHCGWLLAVYLTGTFYTHSPGLISNYLCRSSTVASWNISILKQSTLFDSKVSATIFAGLLLYLVYWAAVVQCGFFWTSMSLAPLSLRTSSLPNPDFCENVSKKTGIIINA